MAIGANTQEGHGFRAIAPELKGEPLATSNEILRRKLIRSGGSAIYEIGDAVSASQQLALLRRQECLGCKTGRMQRRPETVTRAREVVAGGGRVQPWIDADEQHAQAGRDYVLDALAGSRREIGCARSTGRCIRPISRPAQA